MNKKLIVSISGILKTDASVIEAELQKADGDDSILQAYKDKYPNTYTAVELHTLIDNANKKYLAEYDPKPGEIPAKLYNTVKLATLLPIEKSIATKHGITDYVGLDDLLAKVSEKHLTGDKGKIEEITKQQIETLKKANETLLREKEDGIKAAEEKYNSELIGRDLSSALTGLPLDYEDDADATKSVLKKQMNLVDSTFKQSYKVERRDGITVVLDADGKPVVDALGSPKKVSDVMNDLAKDYGFKLKTVDPGNRGLPGSPPNTGANSLKGKEWDAVLKEKGVTPLTEAADKLYIEFQAANPKP